MDYIYILFVTEIFLLILAYWISDGDIISPSVVSIFMFLISTVCVMYNYQYWNVEYSFRAYYTITAGLLTMIVTESFIIIIPKRQIPKTLTEDIKLSEIKPIYIQGIKNVVLIAAEMILFVYFIMEVLRLGRSLGSTGLMAIGTVKESIDLDTHFSSISKLAYNYIFLISIIYIYAFINNVIICKEKLVKNTLYIIPIIMGFITEVFRGARGPLLQYIGIIFIIYIVLSRWKKGLKSVDIIKFIKIVIPVTVIILLSFYMLRQIVKGRTIRTSFVDYITYYIGSPLYLFNKYLDNPSLVYYGPKYFGGLTFTNFYNTLYRIGVVDNRIGILNYTKIGGGFNGGGNEYTFFMRPHYDFGSFGMILFTSIFYGIFSWTYYTKIKYRTSGEKRFKTLLIYAYFYYMVLLSFYYTFTVQEVRPQTFVLIMVLMFLYKICFKIKIVIRSYYF